MVSFGRLVCLSFLSAYLCVGAIAHRAAKKPFTLEQVMSAPFNSELIAAPTKNAFAWVADVEGRRNIWVAFPTADGHDYTARQLTDYRSDDGQAISDLAWSPDARILAYVRGGSSDNPEKRAPNPAHLADGAEQDVWMTSLNGGAARKVGAGHAPTFSPAGDLLTWFSDGQIWYQRPADIGAKPPRSIRVFGDCKSFTWSPDGRKLAFVSDRGSHSFVGVFSPATDSIAFVDPGSDHDSYPVWSPDSREIAFIRVPYFKEENFDGPQRTGEPWSIRVADVATGQGRELWRAAAGQGSVFRALDATQQLYWMADGRLIFPWEADGWLHLYSIASDGGKARLLTPGKFEVENATGAPDRSAVVYSSNQNDSERRHIWKVSASTAPFALSSGEGIETQPAVGSDSRTVAVLRSDARMPMRPAVLAGPAQIRDLAPQMIPADFPSDRMVAPQAVTYSATDGMRIHGDLFLPPASGACVRHPAVVFVHGGSQRQMLLGWHSMDYYSGAYALDQYLVSRGYVVLSINYRSGIGYGLDFREALQYGPTGASEFRDVEGAGLYLRGRCDVEPDHIGIWGGSWGGFLTALALARDSKLFAAGVDLSGVHDWNIDNPQNFQISDTAVDINARWRLAWQSSPLASVDEWRSPVLLVQGDNDDEVPFLQTVQLAAALRQRKVAVRELIFPDEVHDFLLYRNWLAAYSATAAFFDEHFRGAHASPAP
jgi:dipeptidyl aminopeptidase/acylaminoacyl peptidase